MVTRYVLPLLLLTSLTACRVPATAPDAVPGYAPRAGTVLVLHQPLNIPPGKLAVYMQGGQVVNENSVDQYKPNCRLALAELSDTIRTVKPDRFLILGTRFETETRWQQPVRLARRGALRAGDGGPSPEPYVTHFRLHSEQQPAVRKLECSHWVDPVTDAEHLSARQIRNALGTIMTIESGS